MNKQQLCSNCVLPESSAFHLDDEGICNLCKSPELTRHIMKKPDTEKLDQLIELIRKNGAERQYDCIVGWSGGRDSTYMLYELVNKYKLRCAAVFGKTPFTPHEITENVRSISSNLNIKLIEIKTPSNHLEIASFCLMKYLETPKPILINLACAPCKFVNREVFRQAKKHGIRTVIYGGNRFEYFPSGPASIDLASENRYSFLSMLIDNFLRLKNGACVLFRSLSLLRYAGMFFRASVLYVNQYTVYLKLRYPDIFRFDYYHFADWDESEILKVLHELNWKLPQGCNSTWRADCTFEAVKNTAFKNSLGFTYTQALYSNLIRSGKISREEALKRVEKEEISAHKLHEALKMCGLPENSFDN